MLAAKLSRVRDAAAMSKPIEQRLGKNLVIQALNRLYTIDLINILGLPAEGFELTP